VGEIAEEWERVPHKGAIVGVAIGFALGLLTNDVLVAVIFSVVLAVFIFVRPTLQRRTGGWATIAFVPLLVAVFFGTMPINTAAPVPLPGGNSLSQIYDCGSVLQHPFKDPIGAWANEDRSQLEIHMENSTDKHGVVEDCRPTMNDYRVDTAVALGLALLGFGIAWIAYYGRSTVQPSVTE
jgi:hypothetical protein